MDLLVKDIADFDSEESDLLVNLEQETKVQVDQLAELSAEKKSQIDKLVVNSNNLSAQFGSGSPGQ